VGEGICRGERRGGAERDDASWVWLDLLFVGFGFGRRVLFLSYRRVLLASAFSFFLATALDDLDD